MPSPASAEPQARPALSVLVVALICSSVLLAYLLIVAFAFAAGVKTPGSGWGTVLVLFLAIQICAWCAFRGGHGSLSKSDLARLSGGCALSFVLIDLGLPRAFQWAGLVTDVPVQRATVKAIVAVLFDMLLVAGIVFLTVPLVTRLYRRKDVA